MEYLNTLVSVVNLAQRTSKTEGKDFAIASDCLETWDDSDSITVVNAQKSGDMLQNGANNHSTITKARFRDQLSTYGSSRN